MDERNHYHDVLDGLNPPCVTADDPGGLPRIRRDELGRADLGRNWTRKSKISSWSPLEVVAGCDRCIASHTQGAFVPEPPRKKPLKQVIVDDPGDTATPWNGPPAGRRRGHGEVDETETAGLRGGTGRHLSAALTCRLSAAAAQMRSPREGNIPRRVSVMGINYSKGTDFR